MEPQVQNSRVCQAWKGAADNYYFLQNLIFHSLYGQDENFPDISAVSFLITNLCFKSLAFSGFPMYAVKNIYVV